MHIDIRDVTSISLRTDADTPRAFLYCRTTHGQVVTVSLDLAEAVQITRLLQQHRASIFSAFGD